MECACEGPETIRKAVAESRVSEWSGSAAFPLFPARAPTRVPARESCMSSQHALRPLALSVLRPAPRLCHSTRHSSTKAGTSKPPDASKPSAPRRPSAPATDAKTVNKRAAELLQKQEQQQEKAQRRAERKRLAREAEENAVRQAAAEAQARADAALAKERAHEDAAVRDLLRRAGERPGAETELAALLRAYDPARNDAWLASVLWPLRRRLGAPRDGQSASAAERGQAEEAVQVALRSAGMRTAHTRAPFVRAELRRLFPYDPWFVEPERRRAFVREAFRRGFGRDPTAMEERLTKYAMRWVPPEAPNVPLILRMVGLTCVPFVCNSSLFY
jgi:hypothetical protein